ncbi:hypothetical protein GQ457_14G022050 [Hibiscus cannabinus]
MPTPRPALANKNDLIGCINSSSENDGDVLIYTCDGPLCVPTVAPNVEEVPCPDIRDTGVASSMDTTEPHVDEVAPSTVSLSTPMHDHVSDNIEVPSPAAPAAVEMAGEDVSQKDVSSSAPECVPDPCVDICHDSAAGTSHDSLHNSTDALGPYLPVYFIDVEANVNNRLTEEVTDAIEIHALLLK